MSAKKDRSSTDVSGTEGRARVGVVIALAVFVMFSVGLAVLFLGGDEPVESTEGAAEQGFEEPYRGGDEAAEQEPEGEEEDSEPEVVEEFDPDSWDGEFRDFSSEEIEEALRRKLDESEPEEYDEAIEEVEMSIRRAANNLDPEARREYYLNFDRGEMTRTFMGVLREYVDEETYRDAVEQVDYWQDGQWRDE